MRKDFAVWLCLFLAMITLKSNAQEQQSFIGIKGGIAIPNLSARGGAGNPLNTGYSSRLGPDAAVFYEHAFSSSFSVVPGIEYSSQGGKKTGFQPFPFPTQYTQFFPPGQAPTYLYANFKNEIKLNYIMVNVLAKYNLHLSESSPLMLYAEAGPFGAYLVSAKDVTSGSSIIYADAQMQQPLIPSAISFDNKMGIKDQVHKGNFGISGNVGIAYNINNSRIFAEAGGNYGLLNIQKDASNGKNQTGALIVSIGYAYSFGANE